MGNVHEQPTSADDFDALVRDCRVQSSYKDVSGRSCRASINTLLSVLQTLGLSIKRPSDAGRLLQDRRHERQLRGIEPVHLAWNGLLRPILVTMPGEARPRSIEFALSKDGQSVQGGYRLDELPADPRCQSDQGFTNVRLPLPKRLGTGYYDLEVSAGSRVYKSLVISSPRQAYTRARTDQAENPGDENGAAVKSGWGCFLPLYALRTNSDWGVGDLTSLRELLRWASGLGSSDVGTLPLLAAFLDDPLEISPYRPASRLFWNELYIDVEAVPELHNCPQCTQLIESPEFQASKNTLRMHERVDYREAMRLKRRVLELLAANFFANDTDLQRLKTFVRENPLVEDYARFRAALERQRKSWQDWPVGMKGGRLKQGDYDPSVVNYHLFVQWVANAQLAEPRDESNTLDCHLYLDLPIGVHPRGFDTWRYQQQYVEGASIGAPPDVVFPKGQDWGLPPLHPELSRENGHELFRKVMQNNCQYAGRLRIDHILGFHRLYCIPHGASAAQGAFVRNPADELYAIAIVESHRGGCELVGENLGTVPADVDRRLKAHDIAGMWIAPYELEPGRRTALKAPTHHDVAMLNTHDMPPLAAWWKGLDIDERLDLGLIDADAVDRECEQRSIAIQHLKHWLHTDGALTKEEEVIEDDPPVSDLLRRIASTSARLLLINLEDLWFETRSQNIPGLSTGHANWQRKARFRLEEFRNMSQITNLLLDVHAVRTEQKQLARH